MPQTRTATIMVMTGTGSRFETEHENGLAHFLEHMFFKGTKKRPSARQISEELDTIGSVYNAYTSKDRTAYYAKVSNRYIDTAIDVISDMFLHSTLPPAEVTKERGAILQEIDMYEDMPMRTVSDVFDALIFSDDAEPSSHALARTILGPKENIRRFTRADFQAYLKRNYLPGNTVVCVAGAFSQAKVLKKIRADFSQPQADELPIHVPFTATQSAPRVAIKQKATDQTQLILGVPAYPYGHRDEYALSVLTTILGGGMSSRLFIEVREKRGLAYTVSAWTDKYPDAGYLAVQAGVEHAKLSKTIATILSELRKLKRTAVSQTELNKAKAYIRGTKTLSLETCDEIAGNAASSILNFGKVRTLEEYMAGIDAVTSADLTRVARDIFKTERLNLAVIGPHTNRDSLSSLLKI
jgi:predicted Zn-dependent peptidase